MRNILSILTVVVLLASCAGDNDIVANKYFNYRAKFSYRNIAEVPNLYRACTAEGEFCYIEIPLGDANNFHVTSSSLGTTDIIPRAAIDGYVGYALGIGGGLIIGKTNIPEIGTTNCVVVCYDGCCPNCHKNRNTYKKLTIKDGEARCSACNGVYNMNNYGEMTSGDEKGRSLYRYYVVTDGNSVLVDNGI